MTPTSTHRPPPATFQQLPEEMIAEILEIAVESQLQGFHACSSSSFQYEEEDFIGPRLFATLQINSETRAIALQHRRLWTPLAELILASLSHRKHENTVKLLKYACDRSQRTLQRLHSIVSSLPLSRRSLQTSRAFKPLVILSNSA